MGYEVPENDIDPEAAAGFMSGILEATNNQMKMGLELAKLVVENSPDKLNEKEIYSIFRKAIKAISDNTNVEETFRKLGMR